MCGEFLFLAQLGTKPQSCNTESACYDADITRDLSILFIDLVATVDKLIGPGGARAVIAESILVKHQLIIMTSLIDYCCSNCQKA